MSSLSGPSSSSWPPLKGVMIGPTPPTPPDLLGGLFVVVCSLFVVCCLLFCSFVGLVCFGSVRFLKGGA